MSIQKNKIYLLKEMIEILKYYNIRKRIIIKINHPLIIIVFQEVDNLFLVINYLNDGDLRFHLLTYIYSTKHKKQNY